MIVLLYSGFWNVRNGDFSSFHDDDGAEYGSTSYCRGGTRDEASALSTSGETQNIVSQTTWENRRYDDSRWGESRALD